MIRASVKAAWRPWNLPFEGEVACMYLDTLGLVTTGMGNLVDPLALAAGLPWLRADGTPAVASEIEAEWHSIKNSVWLAKAGANAARRIASLHLAEPAIGALIEAKLDQFAAILVRHAAFAAFESWPADAQLGLLSMAWAMGPNFGEGYPVFSGLVAGRRWREASAACAMRDAGGDIGWRNNATAMAFRLAATEALAGGDPDRLQSPVPPLPLPPAPLLWRLPAPAEATADALNRDPALTGLA